jgi:hypothetical protein
MITSALLFSTVVLPSLPPWFALKGRVFTFFISIVMSRSLAAVATFAPPFPRIVPSRPVHADDRLP